MFILTRIADLITIAPSTFTTSTRQALEDEINSRYANKIIHKVGLCICLFDILKTSEGLIGYGTGMVNVNVEFRLVVFRPFKGEVLTGRISSASAQGIHVRLDFFDEILIPSNYLFENCTFDHAEQVWIWHNGDDMLYLDKNEIIRFRVEEERFIDKTPVNPSLRDQTEGDKNPPYQIIVSSYSFVVPVVHFVDD